jgi:hypothetical protein
MRKAAAAADTAPAHPCAVLGGGPVIVGTGCILGGGPSEPSRRGAVLRIVGP